MNDFSCMQWEPCITKHNARYDDPWQDHYTARDRKGSHKPLLVYDTQTGQISDWKNRELFANEKVLSASTISNAISVKRVCLGRYILANTIDGLFQAMAKHGYQ